jgi:uncharacterized protein DUF4157
MRARPLVAAVDRAHGEERDSATDRRGGDRESAQLGVGAGAVLSGQARLLFSLQQSAGNRAVSGLAQRSPEPRARRNDTGLPDELKSGIESLSGVSLDDVNVHYSSSRPAQLNAAAYAQGTDIHVAPGQEQHLPHEAWHIVQQAQGRVHPTMQLEDGVPVNDDEALEQEADVMGAKAFVTTTQLQRAPEDPRRVPAAVVQRVTYRTVPTEGRTQGRVDTNIAGNRITAVGEIYGTVDDGVYRPVGNTKHVVNGALTYKTEGNALVIDVISSSPKRTSVGEILVFHLANLAAERGRDFIGTDLSALEEGTPEFYRKIGLRPAEEWAAAQNELVDAEEQAGKFNIGTPPENAAAKEKRRLYLQHSGALRGRVGDVVRNSQAFRNYWTV